MRAEGRKNSQLGGARCLAAFGRVFHSAPLLDDDPQRFPTTLYTSLPLTGSLYPPDPIKLLPTQKIEPPEAKVLSGPFQCSPRLDRSTGQGYNRFCNFRNQFPDRFYTERG
jgi:hypothetical protein